MNPKRLFAILARLEQSGCLPDDGPTSIFLRPKQGAFRATQLAVCVSGDEVLVRVSRLPFTKPIVFSRQALRVARICK